MLFAFLIIGSIKVTAVSVTWTASAITHPPELTQEPCLNCQAENDSEKWNQRDEWSHPPLGGLQDLPAGQRYRPWENPGGRWLWIGGEGTGRRVPSIRGCNRSSRSSRWRLGLDGAGCHYTCPGFDTGISLLRGNLLHWLAEWVPRNQQRDLLGALHHDVSASCRR